MNIDHGTALVGILLLGLSASACVTNNFGGVEGETDEQAEQAASGFTENCKSTCDAQAEAGCGMPSCEDQCAQGRSAVPAECESDYVSSVECMADATFECDDGGIPIAAACEYVIVALVGCLDGGGEQTTCGLCSEANDCLHTCECWDGAIEAGVCDNGCCGSKSDACSSACSAFGGWMGY